MESIVKDVLEMIRVIEADRIHPPATVYLPDEAIRDLGGNPEDYQELIPGVRIVEYSSES